MPNVRCPACQLESYIAAPHTVRPQCPHCDADLAAAVAADGRFPTSSDPKAEAAV